MQFSPPPPIQWLLLPNTFPLLGVFIFAVHHGTTTGQSNGASNVHEDPQN